MSEKIHEQTGFTMWTDDTEKEDEQSYFNASCAFAESGGTHATGADVLVIKMPDTVYDAATGKFYRKKESQIVHRPENRIFQIAREILTRAAIDGRDNLESLAESGADISKIWSIAGKSRKKAEDRGFLQSTIALFSERVLPDTPDGAIPWHDISECHALNDCILDLRGPKEVFRTKCEQNEYYKHVIPIMREQYENADPWDLPKYDSFIEKIYVDPKTRETAEYCNSLTMGNRGTKYFIIDFGPLANNGKDTEHELKAELIPGRIKTVPEDLVKERGNEGVNRFGPATLREALEGSVSELGKNELSVSRIKNLTNGATIRGEEKGRQSFEFKQKFVLRLKTNVLPSFEPDQGFLNRMICIPYNTCFFLDEENHQKLLEMGVHEDHLFPQEDREKLFNPILEERAGIIKRWAFLYIYLRDELNRKIPESKECRDAKEKYRAANDLLEQFFLEYLVRFPEGSVSNSEIEELWSDFSSKTWGRGKLKEVLSERFDFIKVKRLTSGWHLLGISTREVST